MSSNAVNLLGFFGWSFLPDFVAGHLQTFYYGLTIRAGEPRPQPGTLRFAKDRRIIKGVVVVAYLLFTLYEAHWEIVGQGDFYSALGVAHDVDEKTLQSRFRRLTLIHHPDKIVSAEARPAAEAYYIYLKQARDTLVDPAKRFAYDRFGPHITEWKNAITIHEYVMIGLNGMFPFYLGSSLVMVGLQYFGYLDQGKYWRWLILAAQALFELRTVTRPDFPALVPSWASKLIPASSLMASYRWHSYLPYQTLKFVHKATFTLFLAMGQLGPLITTPLSGPVQGGNSEEERTLKQINRVEQIVKVGAGEVGRLTALELVPFQDSTENLNALKVQLKDWLITNTVRNDKQVQSAVMRVLDRRRRESGGMIDST